MISIFEVVIAKFSQKITHFLILMHFNENLMKFQLKAIDLHDKIFWNHGSKKYENIFLESSIIYTFQKCVQEHFMIYNQNDFDFLKL